MNRLKLTLIILLATIFGFTVISDNKAQASAVPANYSFDYHKAQVGRSLIKLNQFHTQLICGIIATLRSFIILRITLTLTGMFSTPKLKTTRVNELCTITLALAPILRLKGGFGVAISPAYWRNHLLVLHLNQLLLIMFKLIVRKD